MFRRIRKIFRYGLILFLIMLFSGVAVFAISSMPHFGDSLLHIEVYSHNGDEVQVSVPTSLFGAVYNALPQKIRSLCQELEITPSLLARELNEINGEDLVRVTGEDNIRIYMEPISSDSLGSQGFVTVHVKDGGDHGQNINVWVPRGLVSIAGVIVRMSGVVDRYVELPPEIARLRVLEKTDIEF